MFAIHKITQLRPLFQIRSYITNPSQYRYVKKMGHYLKINDVIKLNKIDTLVTKHVLLTKIHERTSMDYGGTYYNLNSYEGTYLDNNLEPTEHNTKIGVGDYCAWITHPKRSKGDITIGFTRSREVLENKTKPYKYNEVDNDKLTEGNIVKIIETEKLKMCHVRLTHILTNKYKKDNFPINNSFNHYIEKIYVGDILNDKLWSIGDHTRVMIQRLDFGRDEMIANETEYKYDVLLDESI